MTFTKQCLNCACTIFRYDPRDYQIVRLHPDGGIIPDESVLHDGDFWNLYPDEWIHDQPEQVICLECGLEVERIRLDPTFDWNAKPLKFGINIHEASELKHIRY